MPAPINAHGLPEQEKTWLKLRKDFRLTPYIYVSEVKFKRGDPDTRPQFQEDTILINDRDFFCTKIVVLAAWPSIWRDRIEDRIIVSPFAINDIRPAEAWYDVEIWGNRDSIVERTTGHFPPFHSRSAQRILPGGVGLAAGSSLSIRVHRPQGPTYVIGTDVDEDLIEPEIVQVVFHGFELWPRRASEDFSQYIDRIAEIYNFTPYAYKFQDAASNYRASIVLPPAIGASDYEQTVDFNTLTRQSPYYLRSLKFQALRFNPIGAPGSIPYQTFFGFAPVGLLTRMRIWDQFRNYQNRPAFTEAICGTDYAPIEFAGDWIVAPKTKMNVAITGLLHYPDIGANNAWTLFGSMTGTDFRLRDKWKESVDGETIRRVAAEFMAER